MTQLNATLYASVDAFRAEVIPHLRQQEPENSLPLGLISRSDPEFPILAVITDHDRPILAAIQTDPPMNLVLSFSDRRDAADCLAHTLLFRGFTLPGVVGPIGLVEHFVNTWTTATRMPAQLQVKERIFAIQQVERRPAVPGFIRWAEPADLEWLTPWVVDFMREAMPEAPVDRTAAMVARRIQIGLPEAGYLVLEIAAQPVSLAGFGGPTGTGIRVGPVYTPPSMRNRGYGMALVRELTARLFELEYQSVFLFTDLANPTSNSIYQKIGYRPVADVNQYQFGT